MYMMVVVHTTMRICALYVSRFENTVSQGNQEGQASEEIVDMTPSSVTPADMATSSFRSADMATSSLRQADKAP